MDIEIKKAITMYQRINKSEVKQQKTRKHSHKRAILPSSGPTLVKALHCIR